jgi:ubiquinone/menaquinone biosynthesis C-methylase UbiE
MRKNMRDLWKSGDPYEYFMGRWSSVAAQVFLDWLSPSQGLKWLDIGCGSGALSESAMNGYKPENLIAIDQSEEYVVTAQKRLGSIAHCKVGNALDLPIEDCSVELTVSGLVLNFIQNVSRSLAEMKRVTVKGGTVAIYVWAMLVRWTFFSIFGKPQGNLATRLPN